MLVKNYEEILTKLGYLKNEAACWWPKRIPRKNHTVRQAREIFTVDKQESSRGIYKEYSLYGNYLSLRLL